MKTELRTLRPEEWDVWFDTLQLAFGGVPEEPEKRALWKDLTETDRSVGGWDGDTCVATSGAFSFRVVVPGGSLVPAAGVTTVSVRPTHRRRGLLREMMRRQLDDVRARSEPLAVLTASEPEIYGRFGYGAATAAMGLDTDTRMVRLNLPDGADQVAIRLVTPQEGLAECERVYGRLVTERPGRLARMAGWERLGPVDPPGGRDGAGQLMCALAEVDGEVRGYARYAVKPAWDSGGPMGGVIVRDLEALDPVARAALWRYLFSIDLTSSVRIGNLPVDDPVLHLVSDMRRCRISVRESLFVRLVDVGEALAARSYAAPVDVVLDVADPFCPWNQRRWRLVGDAKGASCEPTADPADLALSVRELGAAYLGGFSLNALAGAGRVRELRSGALAEASTAFGSDLAPWLPHGF